MESEAEDVESVRAPTPQLVEGEDAKVEEAPEILVIPLSKRVKVIEDIIQINRLLKSQS
jgi:CheY-specific phosphatase CheX